jgi:hypothetical protein
VGVHRSLVARVASLVVQLAASRACLRGCGLSRPACARNYIVVRCNWAVTHRGACESLRDGNAVQRTLSHGWAMEVAAMSLSAREEQILPWRS